MSQGHDPQVLLDETQHRLNGEIADGCQPLSLGCKEPLLAVARRQTGTHGFQVIAGIETRRNRTDVFAKRLAVAQIGRPRQNIDLRAGVVDIVFPTNVETGFCQETGQDIAENGTPGMSDMHRPGRVGRHILDIDPLPLPDRRVAVARAGSENIAQPRLPETLGEPPIQEARACYRHFGDLRVAAQLTCEQFRQLARRNSGASRQDHRRIRRHIAMCGIAWRLDGHLGEIKPLGEFARSNQTTQRRRDFGIEIGKGIHGPLAARFIVNHKQLLKGVDARRPQS